MGWLPIRWMALTSIAAALLMLAAPAHAEKRVALVIMVAENQTRQAFSQTLLQFDKTIDPGDTAFFFFAGHGGVDLSRRQRIGDQEFSAVIEQSTRAR